MPFRYRLIDESGEDLGPLASKRSDWSPGEKLSRSNGESLLVVRVVPVEPQELFTAYLLVRRETPDQSAGGSG
jgi:hypothetical protein